MNDSAKSKIAIESNGDLFRFSARESILDGNQPNGYQVEAHQSATSVASHISQQTASNAEAAFQQMDTASAYPRSFETIESTNNENTADGESVAASQSDDSDTDRFYAALELTLSATQDEIKSQYKRLVRLYHPDQFVDATQKSIAEERLKAINEAYRVLSSRAVEGQLVKYAQQAMGLVVEPAMLDFGLMARRLQRTAAFQVRFEKEIQSVDFVPSEEDSWFRVSKVSHVYGSHHTSLEFDVEVDTTGLSAQTYQGWIDLYLDDAMTRLPLTVQVAGRLNRLSWQTLLPSRRWVLAATFVLAFMFFTTSMAFTTVGPFSLGTKTDDTITDLLITNHNRAGGAPFGVAGIGSDDDFAEIDGMRLYFSLLDGEGQPAIYTTDLQNTISQVVASGTAASGLQSHHVVAYLDQRAAHTQVLLYNQSTGRTEQLTRDPLPKSHLAWSPDGTYLAYLVGARADARIGLYHLEQQHETRLPGAVTAGVSNFAWSPDSKSLLFDLWRGQERRVYRMAVPNGELQQLTQFDSWAGSWSSDGNAIVVGSATGLYWMDSSGRQLRQISTETAERPLWSADGSWIAFLAEAPDRNRTERRLWIIRPDGSGASHVATDILWHEWSPGGATLGYVTGKRGGTESLYYLWIAQPTGQARLVAEINEPYFAWSRD